MSRFVKTNFELSTKPLITASRFFVMPQEMLRFRAIFTKNTIFERNCLIYSVKIIQMVKLEAVKFEAYKWPQREPCFSPVLGCFIFSTQTRRLKQGRFNDFEFFGPPTPVDQGLCRFNRGRSYVKFDVKTINSNQKFCQI